MGRIVSGPVGPGKLPAPRWWPGIHDDRPEYHPRRMGGIEPPERAGPGDDSLDGDATTLPGSDDTPGAYLPPRKVAPGTVLGGRYRIERPLGKGGMGVVYAAHDTVDDRPVAV